MTVGYNGLVYIVVALAFLIFAHGLPRQASASPPACDPSPVGLFVSAHSVVAAEVLSAIARSEERVDGTPELPPKGALDDDLSRWIADQPRIHVTVAYRTVDVFKGGLKPGDEVELVSSCVNASIPEAYLGYPIVEDFCPGTSRMPLAGVDWTNGEPRVAGNRLWILFLQSTGSGWSDISATKFAPERCRASRSDLTPQEKVEYDRLMNFNVRH
jgi:hypothetical protein